MAFTFTSFTSGTPILASAMNGNFVEIASKALDKTTAQTLSATLTAREITPASADTYNLGGSANRWSTVYGVAGDFSLIAFPATQSASGNPNTLDDYEEGTWTPTLTINGSGAGITYSAQSGHYVKIGQLTYVSGAITLSNKGSTSGQARIAGLPFTSTTGSAGLVSVVWCTSMAALTSLPVAAVGPSSTVATLWQFGATAAAVVAETNLTNTSQFEFAGVYRTSA